MDVHNELRRMVYFRDGGICTVCGKPGNLNELQLAHQITKKRTGKRYVMNLLQNKYNVSITWKNAEIIVNHPKVFKLACPGNCNDKVNAFFKTKYTDTLIIEIAWELGFI